MGFPDKILPHYTYEDWIQWEGHWELLEGHPIAMSPSPSHRHQRVSAELIFAFIEALRKSGCRHCRVYDAMDYKITEDTIFVPDMLIVCGEIQTRVLDFAPRLVVEILSPATALRDRNTKAQLYAQQGVRYYLIADTDLKTIETFELRDGAYHPVADAHSGFDLDVNCHIYPDLSAVFD